MITGKRRWMKGCGVVALTTLSSVNFLFAAENEEIIRKINYVYSGNDTIINRSVVESRVQLKVDDVFDPKLANASIHALYDSGWFDNVQVRTDAFEGGNGVEVSFLLETRTKLGDIRYEGNQHIKSKYLSKKIESNSGGAISIETLNADKAKLLDYYESKGYPDARIDYEIKECDESGRSDVVFNIQEGPKLRISKIKIENIGDLKEDDLLKILNTKTWNLFSIFTKKGIFRNRIWEDDISRLKVAFKNQGYLDVEIADEDIVFTKKGKDVVIVIHAVPGEKYRVGKVQIVGNKLHSLEEIERFFNIKTGDVFSPARIDAACERVRNYYGHEGYVNTMIVPVRKMDIQHQCIDLDVQITESEKCFLKDIEIHGNSKTQNKVILRELALAPGDPFDIVRMKNSRERLLNTGYFKQVDVTPVNTNVPERKNLRIDVQEENTGKLGCGGGISSGGNVVGYLEFSQRNFDWNSKNRLLQGGGQKARARLQIGKHNMSIDLNFEQPWWYDREVSVGADAFYHKQDYRNHDKNFTGASYDESRLGFEVYLRKRIYEQWVGRLAYHLEDVYIHNISRTSPASYYKEKGHTSISKISFTADRDTRDHFLYPTEGSHVVLTTELAGGPCFGETKYISLGAQAAKYWKISDAMEQVFSVLGRIGTITPFGHDTVPFFEKFNLGGNDYMKGFKVRNIGPQEGETALGGDSFWYANAEYCFKLHERVRVYLFSEVGAVNESKWNFSTKRYNFDIGFGWKLMIFNFPLRLDFGWPMHSEQNIKRNMHFNYSFGMSF